MDMDMLASKQKKARRNALITIGDKINSWKFKLLKVFRFNNSTFQREKFSKSAMLFSSKISRKISQKTKSKQNAESLEKSFQSSSIKMHQLEETMETLQSHSSQELNQKKPSLLSMDSRSTIKLFTPHL